MNIIKNNLEYVHVDIRKISDANLNQTVLLRGRVHTIRITGNIAFIILRYQTSSLQVIASKKVIESNCIDNYKKLKLLTNETIIDCIGTLRKSQVEIKSTSYKHYELDLLNFNIINISRQLPFQIDDANDYGESFRSDVKNNTKMEYRWMDLRTPVNNSIFKIRSSIINYFRTYLLENDFIEINTPKIIGVQSESGSQVFQLDYFGESAFLAQSPQLYKQMAINSDFDKVFEIGPIFRAENSVTTRHMCEFTGLDVEFVLSPNNNYNEIQEMLWNTITYIFDKLKVCNTNEILYIKSKLPFDDPIYPKLPLIFKFNDCVEMLRKDGKEQSDFEDLSTINERRIGEIIKEQYNSDLFIINQYPTCVRPFYSMPNENNPKYSNSFDMIFRCVEISSGAQRIHDYDLLFNKVIENNINPNTLKYYLNSFSHGSLPHGGFGIGLDRLVSLYLGLSNVKMSSFCPRDPKRLFP